VVDGEKMDAKNMIALDYPDIEGSMSCNIKHGDFGPARKEVAEATGVERANFEIDFFGQKTPGVVDESGTKMTMWGFANMLDTMKWLSPEDIKKAKENRDDFNEPSCPHITPKPGAPGKIYWCSGPPGAGKSTTCQLLARKNGYVYYEADATMQLINPFVPNDADNPSLAQMHQKSLKGVPREDAETILKFGQEMEEMWKGNIETFDEKMRPLLRIMCREIAKQQKRLGGNMAVAQAIVSRESRDICRKHLGGPENVTFLVMNLTKDCQKKRLAHRHGDDSDGSFAETLSKMFDMYEPAGEDEEGAYNVTITEDMSKDDVLKQVLDTIAKI